MKIKEGKNIKYDCHLWIGSDEGCEKFDPAKCFLSSFERVDDKIILHFKNGSQVVIRALNITGGREIDLIESKLPGLFGKCYEEFLNTGI